MINNKGSSGFRVTHRGDAEGTELENSSRQDVSEKNRNPNIEIRNNLKSKSQLQNPKRVCLELFIFDHLKLFRISDFEF